MLGQVQLEHQIRVFGSLVQTESLKIRISYLWRINKGMSESFNAETAQPMKTTT